MIYLAWDREINISLFFCDVFVWKWGSRPRTSSRCYHDNKSAATFKKGIFVHPPWVPNCLQNLKGGWRFSFPKMFDSYRDLFLNVYPLKHVEVYQAKTCKLCYNKKKNDKVFLWHPRACRTLYTLRKSVPWTWPLAWLPFNGSHRIFLFLFFCYPLSTMNWPFWKIKLLLSEQLPGQYFHEYLPNEQKHERTGW